MTTGQNTGLNRWAAIDLLDHGSVRLVDYMGSDLSIVRSARVSYNAAWRAGENKKSDAALIKYLLMNGHTTPFESVEVQFEIKAPIMVFRQWHRHRTQSYNELSARYRELPETFYTPEGVQITLQSTDNKQMRTKEPNPHAKEIRERMIESCERSFEDYRWMIEKGCPRELARGVLPFFTYSHMFAKANLVNWMRFIKERSHEHAQYEILVYSDAIRDMLKHVAPFTMAVFEEKYKGRF